MFNRESYATFFQQDLLSLLKADLGTFQSGDPAIWIIPSDAPQRGSGIHVYIDRYATKLTNALFQQRVTLTQFNRDTDGALAFDSALAKLRNRYPSARDMVAPYRKETALSAVFLLQIHKHLIGQAIPISPR
jgi:hypothetical protein